MDKFHLFGLVIVQSRRPRNVVKMEFVKGLLGHHRSRNGGTAKSAAANLSRRLPAAIPAEFYSRRRP